MHYIYGLSSLIIVVHYCSRHILANTFQEIKMYHKFSRWSLVQHLLLLMICGYANGEKVARSLIVGEGTHHHVHQGHSTPHMDHSVQVFFTPKDLKLGSTIPVFFRGRNPSSSSPHFLPREEADSIPFSPSKLPFLLQLFGLSQGSSQAKAMNNTLTQCVLVKPIQGETKFCATSLESMLDFVQGIFGSTTKFKALSTQNFAKNGSILQNYTVVDEPREVVAPKMVACHTLPYPYVVYYCHHQESESKVFKVSLRGDKGSKDIVEAVAVCHMDTSQWGPNHASFRVLGIKPGSSPVCHFFPADNLVWVPSPYVEGSGYKVSSM